MAPVPAAPVPVLNVPAAPTETELRNAFDRAGTSRAATAPDTQERANAAALAARIAWVSFDAGRFDEAATWFSRRTALRLESYSAVRAAFKAQSASIQVTMSARIAAAKTDSDFTLLSELLSGLQGLILTQLQILALQNNDSPTLLEIGREVAPHSSGSSGGATGQKKPMFRRKRRLAPNSTDNAPFIFCGI